MNKKLLGSKWYELLKEECDRSYLNDIRRILLERLTVETWYPKADKIFEAYRLTDPSTIKVVMIGQDPYHNGHAHGLAFSSLHKTTPASLRTIFKEVCYDVYGTTDPKKCVELFPHNDLTAWAKQGVFLINPVLTVAARKANSHANIGWQEFTGKSVDLLYQDLRPKVFVLWGKAAQHFMLNFTSSAGSLITNGHLFLTAPHPATASYGKDLFSGCKHFSKINEFLVKNNQTPIEWKLASS